MYLRQLLTREITLLFTQSKQTLTRQNGAQSLATATKFVQLNLFYCQYITHLKITREDAITRLSSLQFVLFYYLQFHTLSLVQQPFSQKFVSIVLTFSLKIIVRQFLSPFHKDYLTTNFNLTTKTTLTIKILPEVYSIQHYVIKFVSDLRQVSGFLQVPQFSPPIKLADILLKRALSTINHLPQQPSFIFIAQCLCIAFNII